MMIKQADATHLRKYIKYLDAQLSALTDNSKDESTNNLFKNARDLDNSLEYSKQKPEEFYNYRFFDEKLVIHYNAKKDYYTIRTYGIEIRREEIDNEEGEEDKEIKLNERTLWTEIGKYYQLERAQIQLQKLILKTANFRLKRLEYGLQ